MESKKTKQRNKPKTDTQIDHTDGCQGGEKWGMTAQVKGNTVNNTVTSMYSNRPLLDLL